MSNRQAIIVDIDGTIADMGKGEEGRRGPFEWDRVYEDTPIVPIINLVRMLAQHYYVIFVSGRLETCREDTVAWLQKHLPSLGTAHLHMRPLHQHYKPDNEVKAEIYRRFIEPTYDVVYVLDDRNKVVKMWRSLGLTVLQVADGDF